MAVSALNTVKIFERPWQNFSEHLAAKACWRPLMSVSMSFKTVLSDYTGSRYIREAVCFPLVPAHSRSTWEIKEQRGPQASWF